MLARQHAGNYSTLELRRGYSASAAVIGIAAALQGAFLHIDPSQAATITGSPVAIIRTPNERGFNQAPNFQRSTLVSPADRPAITSGELVFDGTNDVLDESGGYSIAWNAIPADPSYAEAGKGPTITGMCLLSNGNVAISHYGKKNESTAAGETFNSSILIYRDASAQGLRTLVREIKWREDLGVVDCGPQGIVQDPVTLNLFIADVQNGFIREVSGWQAGSTPALVRSLAFAGVNGLTYESINNQLLVCVANSTTVTRVNKTTGATISTFTIRDITNNTLDHLHFVNDGTAAGALYTTNRDNGTNGRIIRYNLNNGATPVRAWSITECKAIEGGFIQLGNRFLICHDGYYHNQTDAFNRVFAFDVDPTAQPVGTRMVLTMVTKIAATPGSTVACLVGSDPLSTGGQIREGVGVFYTAVANTIRMILILNGNQIAIDWTLTSATTRTLVSFDINTVAHTVDLYENGSATPNATKVVVIGAEANVTGNIPALLWTMGADYEAAGSAARFGAVTLGPIIGSTNAGDRIQHEGRASWQSRGDGSLLAVGHTFKNAAPT